MLSSWGRYNNSFFDVDFSRFLLFWRSDDRISFPLFFYSSRRIKSVILTHIDRRLPELIPRLESGNILGMN